MNDDTATLYKLLERSESPVQQLSVHTSNGKTALMIACKMGEITLVEELLVLGADVHAKTATGGTAFMFASLGGHIELLYLLREKGADISSQGTNGWSAVTIAAAKGYSDVLAVLQGMGADINVRDVYRWTPLMRAVANRHLGAARLLLANPVVQHNTQDETGNTALHHAASNADLPMLALLLKAGVDQTIKNSKGYSAAQLVTAFANADELLALFSAD